LFTLIPFSGRIFLPQHAYDLIAPNSNVTLSLDPVIRKAQEKAKSKGDVFTVAQLAGIMGAKSTSRLIPLCHPLAISHVDVALTPEENTERLEFSVLCRATVRCRGSTGVEMEALTAVNVALLTVWDMLKATAGREMKIGDIFVTEKSGGAGGDFSRQARGEAGPPV
jgi:cyclic pyranopterin phosphate synthase